MIVIVGARISGLTLAGLLARHVDRIVVLDKGPLDSPPLSIATICPDALAIFDEIGFARDLDHGGFPRLEYFDFEILNNVRMRGAVPFSYGRSWCFAIRRQIVDKMLLSRVLADNPNIEIITDFNVDGIIWSKDRAVGITGKSNTGTRKEIRASLVVGADGRASAIARLAQAHEYDVRQIRTAFYYQYYRNFAPINSTPSLTTFRGSHDFHFEAFAHEADAGLVGIGVQAPSKNLRAFSRTPDVAFRNCITSIPVLNERLQAAEPDSEVRGIHVPNMYKRRPFGPGWALLGDAAMHFNPVTGQGISAATQSAKLLRNSICLWLNGTSFDLAMQCYELDRNHLFDAAYHRAAAVADIGAPVEEWRHRWYDWMSRDPESTSRWLKLLTNAIDTTTFESGLDAVWAIQHFAKSAPMS